MDTSTLTGKTAAEIRLLRRIYPHSSEQIDQICNPLHDMYWSKDWAKARTAARKAARAIPGVDVTLACHNTSGVDIEVLYGVADAPVFVEGQDAHWTTPSGKTRVYHPSAYSKKGRCVYHRRTHKVRVGQLWMEAHK